MFLYKITKLKITCPLKSWRRRKNSLRGFSLMELLLYSGILVITAGLLGGIVYTVSKANLRTQAQNELNAQAMRLEEMFRQNIENAKGVNDVNGSSLSLNKDNSTTTFSLTNNTIYFQQGNDSPLPLNDPSKIKVTSLSFTQRGGIFPVEFHYGWNDSVGWIDFGYPGGNVRVPRGIGDLTGGAYILCDNSWISLNCSFTDSCYDAVYNPSGIDYKVSSDINGYLSGWAWSENYGWISFSSSTDNSSYDYGVTVSTSTGEFNGYAWSENIGWISFNCASGGINQNNICLTDSNYLIKDIRTKASAIQIDITLEYNSSKPDQQITYSYTFVFNLRASNK